MHFNKTGIGVDRDKSFPTNKLHPYSQNQSTAQHAG